MDNRVARDAVGAATVTTPTESVGGAGLFSDKPTRTAGALATKTGSGPQPRRTGSRPSTAGEVSKHQIAEEYLAEHTVGT